MGKRRASSRRNEESEEVPQREVRTKHRHDPGTTSRQPVNSSLISLFHSSDKVKLFKEKFITRHVLEYKHVNFTELVKMFEVQGIDTANYLAAHGWTDFVQVNRPIHRTLLRILMANLEESTMMSWIGGRQVDLSMEAWCTAFHLPPISDEEENDILNIEKEELFFRLTGERNLGVQPFIKINQLHQEANVRLTAQVMMTVLIPKKGSKEQIKVEEGRLLYAMIYGKKINLARLIIERVRAAMGRKSTPICYGMHLMELMVQAGVDVTSAGDEEITISSVIDHHTLRRLGYKFQFNTWEYVGKGKVTSTGAPHEQGLHTEEEEDAEDTAQEESAAPSQPSQPHPPRSSSFHLASQISNLATKSDLAHLRQFMVEQFHLMQATLLSKLESMDSRLQNCETQLQYRQQAPIPPPTSQDPKGKAPMVSPFTSPTASPAPTPHIHSPPPSPPAHKSPIHVSSHSTSSSSSSPSDPQQFELAARTPATPTSHSQDSEATPSDPSRFLTTPPPSPPPAPPRPDPPPPPPPPPPTTLTLYSPPPRPGLTPYRRRKQAVTKPGASTSPPPP